MPAQFNDEELLDEPPSSINPYEVLGIEKTATPEQVKTAYRKAALIHHPDKAQPENKDTAHKKFQEIAFAYAILSDARRRARYDITGRTEASLNPDDDDDDAFNWADFYRAQFQDVVTASSIDTFKKEYKGSEEEKEALFAAYNEYEGALDKIYEVIMLSDPLEDEERFRKLLDEGIEKGELPDFPKYTKETAKSRKARMDRAKRDGREARALAKKLGVEDKLFGNGAGGKKAGGASSEDSLAALIQQRQKARAGNFLADLEARYAPKPRGKKRAAVQEEVDEPPEEAFQKNAKPKKGKKSAEVPAEQPSAGTRRSKRSKT